MSDPKKYTAPRVYAAPTEAFGLPPVVGKPLSPSIPHVVTEIDEEAGVITVAPDPDAITLTLERPGGQRIEVEVSRRAPPTRKGEP